MSAKVVAKAGFHHCRYLGIVKQMMFVQGDVEESLEQCQELVLDVVKFQLVKVLEDAFVLTKAKKKKQISLEDVLFQFRRNNILLGRLLKFAKTATSLRSISKDAEPAAELDYSDNSGSEDDSPDDDICAAAKTNAGAEDDIAQVVDSLNLDHSSTALEELVDPVLELRQRRMADKVKSMDFNEYERFADARKATFNPPVKKQPRRRKGAPVPIVEDPLFIWLGNPPVAKQLDFVLGFLAKEIVALIVGDAITVKEQEAQGWFRNEGAAGCIQLRHYQEALRRNIGLRHRNDFLFGHY